MTASLDVEFSLVPGLVLIATGARHCIRMADLRSTLQSHQLRHPFRELVALSLPATELLLGFGLVALRWDESGLPRRLSYVVSLGAVLLFACFAVYLNRIRVKMPSAPCGCGDASQQPVSSWSVVRAVTYGSVSMVSILNRESVSTVALLPHLAVSVILCRLIWLLPQLLDQPCRRISAANS